MSERRKTNQKRNRWTPEEDEWLKSHHPHMGHKDGYKLFCETFGNRHPISAYRTRTTELGIHVTPKRWREACQNNGHRDNVRIGTIVKRGRGQNWIKVGKGTDGWVPLATYNKKVKDGNIIIHLDGDKSNDSPDNLREVSRAVCARMSKQRFWSEEPIVTETGVLCCELQQALSDERVLQ